MARRIKRVGFTYGVLTITDPALARALYRAARIEDTVPPAFYQPVADIYLRYKLGDGRKLAGRNEPSPQLDRTRARPC